LNFNRNGDSGISSVNLKHFIQIAMFAALTGLGSFVRIPFPLVPVTMQTFFVYLSGDLLGRERGALSQILFLAVGLAGIPVFSMGGGIGYVLKPSFGYLLAFPAASWIAGALLVKLKGKYRYYISNVCAAGMVFTAGAFYLYLSSRLFLHIDLSIKTALWTGIVILLPGEIIKILFASEVSHRILRSLGTEGI